MRTEESNGLVVELENARLADRAMMRAFCCRPKSSQLQRSLATPPTHQQDSPGLAGLPLGPSGHFLHTLPLALSSLSLSSCTSPAFQLPSALSAALVGLPASRRTAWYRCCCCWA